jgi:hypothetical protein
VPLSCTVCVLPCALSVIVSVPICFMPALGVNVTETVQEEPAGRLAGQLFVSTNTPGSEIISINTGNPGCFFLPFGLDTFTVLGLLVVPTVVFENLSAFGVILSVTGTEVGVAVGVVVGVAVAVAEAVEVAVGVVDAVAVVVAVGDAVAVAVVVALCVALAVADAVVVAVGVVDAVAVAVAVRVGVAVAVAVGVGVGKNPACSSKAPMSHAVCPGAGRESPRWSVVIGVVPSISVQ